MEATKNGVFISYDEMQQTKPEFLIAQAKGKKTFFTNLVEYWKNGSYFTYKDERTKPFGESFAIRVNNDGSEDLVQLHYNDNESWLTTIKNITPKGEAPLWKEAIDRGFLNLNDAKNFEQKPKDRIVNHSIS